MSTKNPVSLPEGYVDFYKAIETWQTELFTRLKKANQPEPQDTIALLRKNEQPLTESVPIQLDPDAYRAAVMAFIDFVAEARQPLAGVLGQIRAALETIDFSELTENAFHGDGDALGKIAQEKGIPGELFLFLLDQAMRPFLQHFALAYQASLLAFDGVFWDKGECPICGWKATFSRVRAKDGQRYLFCEHCFTEWEHRYLGCMHCGNSEPGTIRYLTVDGDDAHQVFVCDECKGYLKTLDERKAKGVADLFIANIETVYLDMIAEEKGFVANPQIKRGMN
ncbi:MAG: formate dehydrogenase accessory protein FdhE [Solirubrobacterales bacterium]